MNGLWEARQETWGDKTTIKLYRRTDATLRGWQVLCTYTMRERVFRSWKAAHAEAARLNAAEISQPASESEKA
jgi:hypothetical protein